MQRGPSPSSLARALAELGRVIKTLHVLEYAHDPAYRRTIHHLLSRGERRNSLARAVFHGQRGQLRRHYQVGQENQLDSLGIMINVIVLWQTIYIQAALDHLAAKGYPIDRPTSPGSPHLGTPPSTSTVATAPPTAHPPPDSGRYASTDSGSCTNPHHRPHPVLPDRDRGAQQVAPVGLDQVPVDRLVPEQRVDVLVPGALVGALVRTLSPGAI